MPLDLRYCFACDAPLDDPPVDDTRIRRCPICQADLDAHLAALGDFESMPRPKFGGTIALGVPLPGWPTHVAVLALENWGHFAELSLCEMPGVDPPEPHPRMAATSLIGDQRPRKWTFTTDLGSVHHSGGGGGGSHGTGRLLFWHTTIAPPPPEGARRFVIDAQAPGSRARVTIDLADRRVAHTTASAERIAKSDYDPRCPSCGPPPPARPEPESASGIELDWAIPPPPQRRRPSWDVDDPRPICSRCSQANETVLRSKRPSKPMPDRLVAIGAELEPIFGTQPVVTVLACWPDYFELTLAGDTEASWGGVMSGKRARCWTATDDLGNSYLGAPTGASSGLGLTHAYLTFIPTLSPKAASITITFPASIDSQSARAVIDLGVHGS